MKITIDYLETAFDRYNLLCFQGRLPRPTLTLSEATTQLGCMRYAPENGDARDVPNHFTIAVSTAFDYTEEQLDDVIIHEMIHYFIAYHGLRDTSPHGMIFQSVMDSINQAYHRHITISIRKLWGDDEDADGDDAAAPYAPVARSKRQGPYIVLAMQGKNGRFYLTSVARSAVAVLDREAKAWNEYKRMDWLVSLDPRFANFPRVRTFRFVTVTQEEYEQVLRESNKVSI